MLAIGFVLMAINRVSGLVLPASSKFLIDDIFGKKQGEEISAHLGVKVGF